MGIARNSDLGEMHYGDIIALAIHSISPESCHRQVDTPAILAWICCRLRRNVVTVVNDDRDLRQQDNSNSGSFVTISYFPLTS